MKKPLLRAVIHLFDSNRYELAACKNHTNGCAKFLDFSGFLSIWCTRRKWRGRAEENFWSKNLLKYWTEIFVVDRMTEQFAVVYFSQFKHCLSKWCLSFFFFNLKNYDFSNYWGNADHFIKNKENKIFRFFKELAMFESFFDLFIRIITTFCKFWDFKVQRGHTPIFLIAWSDEICTYCILKVHIFVEKCVTWVQGQLTSKKKGTFVFRTFNCRW